MNEAPKGTTTEFVDGLLVILDRFREVLVASKALVEINKDMLSDGGHPFVPATDDVEGCEDVNSDKSDLLDVPGANSHGDAFGPMRRRRITDELRGKILEALITRVPRPKMVDVASEFDVSQSTISRLWGTYQGEKGKSSGRKPPLGDVPPEVAEVRGSSHRPLPGQMDFPILSEGRKPSPED